MAKLNNYEDRFAALLLAWYNENRRSLCDKMNDDIYIVRDMKNFASITDLLQKSKFNFSNVVLKQGILEANYHVSRQLGLELGSKVFFIKCSRAWHNT